MTHTLLLLLATTIVTLGCGGSVGPTARSAHTPGERSARPATPVTADAPPPAPNDAPSAAAPAEATAPGPTAPDPDAQPSPPASPADASPAPPPPVGGARPVIPPEAAAQLRMSLAHLEDDLEAIEGFRPLLARLRGEITLEAGTTPPRACRSGVRDQLTEVIRRGNSQTQWSATSLRDALDELCSRYEAWRAPNDALVSRYRRFLTQLDRIDTWMDEIRRCHDPGPYDGRCQNAYGSPSTNYDAETRRVKQLVAEVRAVTRPVVPSGRRRPVPFPCSHPVFGRVAAATDWELSVARAQVPSIARSAEQICERLGVSPEELALLARNVTDTIDRADAQLLELANSRRTSILQLQTLVAP